jgi:hypothetical protein
LHALEDTVGTPFRVIALKDDVAQYVRREKKAPHYEHPAYTSLAAGHGPCRLCLKTFRVGEEDRILFTLDPFAGLEEVPLPGPVFIHAEDCCRYPEDGGYPETLRPYPAVLVAYAKGQRVLTQIHAAEGLQGTAIAQLLDREDVDYIIVRDHEAGCYDFRVERLNAGALSPGGKHKC